jgi:DNA modification methylase
MSDKPARKPPDPDPAHQLGDPECRVYVGDCRDVLAALPEIKAGALDMVFADPPFNWKRAYDRWDDDMPEREYLEFTYDWLDLCVQGLRPGGTLWVNIPDDWAAEIVCYLKGRLERRPPARLAMPNWCIWHYRFGQNTTARFINSKVHALCFVKSGGERTWNPDAVLELSDRATTYYDPRTFSKKEGAAGKRVPMDVWYGAFWGRIQGNNKERRHQHDNQLPEAYLSRVVLSTSHPGDLILDPFLGSGTTGVIAHALGRRFVGVEYSPENARRAFERIKAGPVRPADKPPPPSPIHRARGLGTKSRAMLAKHGVL